MGAGLLVDVGKQGSNYQINSFYPKEFKVDKMMMSNLPINTLLQKKAVIEVIEKKQPSPSREVIDEVSEGVEGFLTLLTGCEVSFWLTITIALGFTIPYLSPVGLIFIGRTHQKYKQKLRQLREDFDG